jgi:hypothetical protein
MDASNVMRRADLTALRTFERRSPLQGSYLLGLGYGSFPTTVPTLPATRRYVPLQAVAGPVALAEHPTAADLAALTGQYQTYAHTTSGAGGDDLYVLWSPAVQAYGYEYGLMSKRQSAAWRDLLIASPDWQVVYAAQGTLLFHLVHA